jgi:hypothetical protein
VEIGTVSSASPPPDAELGRARSTSRGAASRRTLPRDHNLNTFQSIMKSSIPFLACPEENTIVERNIAEIKGKFFIF